MLSARQSAASMEGNLVAGANIAGFLKVADAMLWQGVAYEIKSHQITAAARSPKKGMSGCLLPFE